ncbi:hypothetical protein [Brevibacillus sp. SIMBA_040]|uniref:hypothetical protein n=1 Tax=unclassified Brevibacillus TaxID=2684853 RepID=UPI00397D828A
MIKTGLVIAVVMAIGRWLKGQDWYRNSLIPLAMVFLAVAINLGNTVLFHGDFLEAASWSSLKRLEQLASIVA